MQQQVGWAGRGRQAAKHCVGVTKGLAAYASPAGLAWSHRMLSRSFCVTSQQPEVPLASTPLGRPDVTEVLPDGDGGDGESDEEIVLAKTERLLAAAEKLEAGTAVSINIELMWLFYFCSGREEGLPVQLLRDFMSIKHNKWKITRFTSDADKDSTQVITIRGFNVHLAPRCIFIMDALAEDKGKAAVMKDKIKSFHEHIHKAYTQDAKAAAKAGAKSKSKSKAGAKPPISKEQYTAACDAKKRFDTLM